MPFDEFTQTQLFIQFPAASREVTRAPWKSSLNLPLNES
jgi:hypothetical protein